MKVIFIAGPYRAGTEWGVHCNIQEAEKIAMEVWKLGACALCPHKNTAYFGGALPDETWLNGALELLSRSDAVFVVSKWRTSEGTKVEMDRAQELGKPVFFGMQTLENWLKRPADDLPTGEYRREKTP